MRWSVASLSLLISQDRSDHHGPRIRGCCYLSIPGTRACTPYPMQGGQHASRCHSFSTSVSGVNAVLPADVGKSGAPSPVRVSPSVGKDSRTRTNERNGTRALGISTFGNVKHQRGGFAMVLSAIGRLQGDGVIGAWSGDQKDPGVCGDGESGGAEGAKEGGVDCRIRQV